MSEDLRRDVSVRASELLHYATVRTARRSHDELRVAYPKAVMGVGLALDGLDALAAQATGPGAEFAAGLAAAIRDHLGDEAPPRRQQSRRPA